MVNYVTIGKIIVFQKKYLIFLGVTKFLLRMCQLSDKDVVLKASAALINILNNYKVRAEIGAMGACKIVHQLLTKYGEDNAMLDGLLGMSLNLIIECFPNRRLLVELDSFLLFMKLYRAPTTNDDNKDVILNILKNLIGNGWRLMDPSNLPDVRGIIQVISFNKETLTKLGLTGIHCSC